MSKYFVEIKGKKWWRYGKIIISGEFYFSKPDLVFEALEKIKFLPIRSEHDLVSNSVTLYGFSPAFKVVSPNEKVIEYKLQIDSKAMFTGDVKDILCKEVHDESNF